MTDEPTAWEDINPPMVSAQRRELASPSSDDEARVIFRNELTACLALVAPVGMTEEAKRDWLAVAWQTLRHIPPRILSIGANAARLKCDHPSKIIPTIMAETEDLRRWDREGQRYRSESEQPQLPPPDYCSPEEARKILEEFGIKRNWRDQ